MGQTIGYARVSTTAQNLLLQQDELQEAGCLKIFSDKESGATSHRPGLDKCLESLKKGDTLLVWRLDRLLRPMPHLVTLVQHISIRKNFKFRGGECSQPA